MLTLDKKDLLERAKITISTWAWKNARGFKEITRKHFDSTSTAAPITNNTTIRIMPILMLLANWKAKYNIWRVHSWRENLRIAKKFSWRCHKVENYYWDLAVLRLLKPIYRLKQAVLLCWQRLLEIMKNVGK